nr:retrovirus-related Pol polyprotein from transposon TNT 1-94 [Tanacetum cinerariifolium]
MSSTEAEYVAAAGYRAQVLWIKSQLADYDVLYDKPITQSKATTDTKSKKKRIPTSSKPMNLKAVRESSSTPQVTNNQPTEKTVATADAT